MGKAALSRINDANIVKGMKAHAFIMYNVGQCEIDTLLTESLNLESSFYQCITFTACHYESTMKTYC